MTQREKEIDRFNLRAGVYPYTRLNPFLYRFDAAAQRAQQAQQGTGRKHVDSKVVEPKLLTLGEHNE